MHVDSGTGHIIHPDNRGDSIRTQVAGKREPEMDEHVRTYTCHTQMTDDTSPAVRVPDTGKSASSGSCTRVHDKYHLTEGHNFTTRATRAPSPALTFGDAGLEHLQETTPRFRVCAGCACL